MASELPLEMSEHSGEVARVPSAPPTTGPLERRIIEYLCEPLLPHIPARVHPNTISLVTHGVVWLTAALAVGSVAAEAPQRSLMLVGAGVGTLLSMIGDCLDGMHARRTGQCSKLGELMDHWLDAIVVPLTIAGITIALEMPAWALVATCVTAVTIYQAQLVLYHHTGQFVHPEPASGVEGQFGVAVAYGALAGLFAVTPRQVPWLDLAIGVVAVLATLVQLRCNAFYYRRLGRHITEHIKFVGMLAVLAVLHATGAVGQLGFLTGLVAISFRISGTYVLGTIVGRRFAGDDLVIYGLLAAAAIAQFAGLEIPSFGPVAFADWPFALAAYVLIRNVGDLLRDRSQLSA